MIRNCVNDGSSDDDRDQWLGQQTSLLQLPAFTSSTVLTGDMVCTEDVPCHCWRSLEAVLTL